MLGKSMQKFYVKHQDSRCHFDINDTVDTRYMAGFQGLSAFDPLAQRALELLPFRHDALELLPLHRAGPAGVNASSGGGGRNGPEWTPPVRTVHRFRRGRVRGKARGPRGFASSHHIQSNHPPPGSVGGFCSAHLERTLFFETKPYVSGSHSLHPQTDV